MRLSGKIENLNGLSHFVVPSIMATGFGKDFADAEKRMQECVNLIFNDDSIDHTGNFKIKCHQISDSKFDLEFVSLEKILPDVLSRIRDTEGISMKEIARRLDLASDSTVRRYFSNVNNSVPTFLKAIDLLRTMGYELKIEKAEKN